MSGDLRIEVEHEGELYYVDFEEESLDGDAIDVRCPNCDSRNVVEHRIGLTEVEIYNSNTLEVVDLESPLGKTLLEEATVIANSGREKPFTCGDCQHNFH